MKASNKDKEPIIGWNKLENGTTGGSETKDAPDSLSISFQQHETERKEPKAS